MRVLLDTHVALWAVTDSPKLGSKSRGLLADPGTMPVVSVVSIWEIAIKYALGRKARDSVTIPGRRSRELFEQAGCDILPVTARHAAAVDDLPLLHGDPFDRMLVAQALCEPMRLLTRDARLKGLRRAGRASLSRAFAAPGEAVRVEQVEVRRARDHRLPERDRAGERVLLHMAVGRAARDRFVSATAERVIEQDALKTMVGADRPSARPGKRGERFAGEAKPFGFQRGAGRWLDGGRAKLITHKGGNTHRTGTTTCARPAYQSCRVPAENARECSRFHKSRGPTPRCHWSRR